MTHLGLFEGIGGFSLAARWMGWETLAWCEINPFCQKVLRHHFPEAEGFTDIKTTDFTSYANKIDILTGGFPCQPYSQAGKRLGKEDDRHLWPEMLRAIREVKPGWVVGENVFGLINWSGGLVFLEVQTDLEAEGYEVFPYVLPACGVNAPHRRDRIWFVARRTNNTDSNSAGFQAQRAKQQTTGLEQYGELGGEFSPNPETTKDTQRNGCLQREPIQEGAEILEQRNIGTGGKERIYLSEGVNSDTDNERLQRSENIGSINGITQKRNKQLAGLLPSSWQNFPTQSPICGGDDGISHRLDNITFSKWRNESIKAYGNAIVPQVVYQIFKAIEQYEQTN